MSFVVVVVVVVVIISFCFVFFKFLATYPKHLSKQWILQKKTKNDKCRNKRTFWQEQLAQVCSQIVSFLFFVFLWILLDLQKTLENGGGQLLCWNWSKVVLKTGPSMLCNKSGPMFNITFWSFWFFCAFVLKILFFLQGERDVQKQNHKDTKRNGPFLTQKRAKRGTKTNSPIYIYILPRPRFLPTF